MTVRGEMAMSLSMSFFFAERGLRPFAPRVDRLTDVFARGSGRTLLRRARVRSRADAAVRLLTASVLFLPWLRFSTSHSTVCT
jgi:hypothetical protein